MRLAVGKTKWLAILEVDEYLLPFENDRLLEVLEKYNDYPGVILSNNCYEAFNLDRDPTRSFVIETTEMTSPPEENVQKCSEKIIFKPECYAGFQWPPCRYVFKKNKKAKVLNRYELRINRYLHRFRGNIHFEQSKLKMHIDNRLLSESELDQLLELGYEIEDQEKAIFRFIPKLIHRMNY